MSPFDCTMPAIRVFMEKNKQVHGLFNHRLYIIYDLTNSSAYICVGSFLYIADETCMLAHTTPV